MVNNRLTVLLTGDLAFLYDRNALWKQPIPNNLKIIVLNNGGGGIFKLIDGPQLHQDNIRFFTTPHQFGMKQVAEEYHMDYYLCQDAQSLNAQLEQFFEPSKNASLLEIKIDINQNAKAIELFKSIKLI
jgi:2-succinyl-5-enolpyruvyl-6-hydroxy-3-cyclohexene-1-carboxylate synthase